MDYRSLYNEYWNRSDRHGEDSFQNVQSVADEIVQCVGLGTTLDVGCGNGSLVRQLSAMGLDAVGLDVSDVAVEVANSMSPGRFVVGDILAMPYEDESYDWVVSTDCFEHLAPEDVAAALSELRRVCKQGVYLRIALTADRDNRWHLTIQDREWWEARCFEAGFRKHPRYFLASPFGCLDSQRDHCTIVLSKIPDEVNDRFPLQGLLAERDLHTDMSREPGRRSDAHNMRYFEAARRVRPGDRVIDIACGLGYGAPILTQNSRCRSYLGIDNSQYAVDYAQASFPSASGRQIDFRLGSLPECLETLEESSFDFVASFETLEHLQDPGRYLQQCLRILSPGGRLMISVPNDWTEEDGEDPNPHHFHVYDWGQILDQLAEAGFLIEATFAKTVSRRKEQGAWETHGYEWCEYAVEEVRDKPSEWCVVLAMKSPFDGCGAEFTNSAFFEAGQPPNSIMDYAQQYQNPWLIPSIVTRGLRTERTCLRMELAQQVIDQQAPNADQAAALCTTAYGMLEQTAPWSETEALLARMAPHYSPRDWHSVAPIDVRWAVSLRYVSALLLLRAGKRSQAMEALEACAELPFLNYAPVLGTKTVGAAILRASLAMSDGDRAAAEHWLRQGLALSQQAVSQDWQAALGDLERQALPVMREMAQVLELGSQCAVGLALLPHGDLGPVFNEQFRATNATEIARLSATVGALLNENSNLTAAVAWHQQQALNWQAIAEGVAPNPSRLGGKVTREVRRLKNQLGKLLGGSK